MVKVEVVADTVPATEPVKNREPESWVALSVIFIPSVYEAVEEAKVMGLGKLVDVM